MTGLESLERIVSSSQTSFQNFSQLEPCWLLSGGDKCAPAFLREGDGFDD